MQHARISDEYIRWASAKRRKNGLGLRVSEIYRYHRWETERPAGNCLLMSVNINIEMKIRLFDKNNFYINEKPHLH
jgi:hypothetical protein